MTQPSPAAGQDLTGRRVLVTGASRGVGRAVVRVLVQAAQLRGEVAVNALDPGWVRTDLGGQSAPGTVEESAAGALALLREPAGVTGRIFKDGEEISF